MSACIDGYYPISPGEILYLMFKICAVLSVAVKEHKGGAEAFFPAVKRYVHKDISFVKNFRPYGRKLMCKSGVVLSYIDHVAFVSGEGLAVLVYVARRQGEHKTIPLGDL